MSMRLQREVWALDRCSGCGACVAVCSKSMLYWDREQHPLLEEREKALGLSRLKLRACEVCEKFCEVTQVALRTVGGCRRQHLPQRCHPVAAGGCSLG
jgi:ferredoxin